MAMIADTNTPATASLSAGDVMDRVSRFFAALVAGQAAARDFERSRIATDGVLSSEQAARAVFARYFG